PFPHVMRGAFLHVNIFAGLRRPNRPERVPMMRRRKSDSVDIFALKQVAKVGITTNVCAAVFDLLKFFVQHRAVDVAERDEAGAGNFAERFDVIPATAIETHDGVTNIAICAGHLRARRRLREKRPGFERGSGEERIADEPAAREFIHGIYFTSCTNCWYWA